jgi:methyl-accepting chemotaxis protein
VKLGISRKILLLIESIIATVVILGGFATFLILQKVITDGANEKISSISSLKRASLELYLDEELDEFESFSKDNYFNAPLVNFLENQDISKLGEVKSSLSSMAYEDDPLSSVQLLNKDGLVVSSSNSEDIGKIKSDKNYFSTAKNKAIISLEYDVVMGKPFLIFAAPIKNSEDKFLGEIVKRMSLSEINKITSSRPGLGETGETYLVNSSNLVVTDLLKEPGSAFKKTIYYSQIELCLKGVSSFAEREDYRGDVVYGHWDYVPELNSCFVVEMDKSEILAPIKNAVTLFSGLMLLIGLIGGLLGLLLARSFVRPIIELRDETVRIKNGNFEKEIKIKSNDEIGDLAKAFNEMEGKIKQEHQALEREVGEKTKQLNSKLKELTEMYSSSEKMNELMMGRELTIVDLKKKISILEKELEEKRKA